METNAAATAQCGNMQLSGGLCAWIEGNLHAVRAAWPQSAGWTVDADITAAEYAVEVEEDEAAEMQQLDTQEDLLQDGSVDGGAEENGAAENGTKDDDDTSPMVDISEAEAEPGTATPVGQPPPAAHVQPEPLPAPPDSADAKRLVIQQKFLNNYIY